MKKNNKGFMLAEVVVVSAVVIVTMVSLYTSFNRVYKNYNERSKYYSVDCLYAGATIENLLIDEFKLTKVLNEYNNLNIKDYCNNIGGAFNDYCLGVYNRYNIKNMFLIKGNETIVNNLINNNSDNIALQRYLNVFIKGITDNEDYYLIIQDNNDYFANLKVVK